MKNNINKETPIARKVDLSDFTFLMPLRIDLKERKENADKIHLPPLRYKFQIHRINIWEYAETTILNKIVG